MRSSRSLAIGRSPSFVAQRRRLPVRRSQEHGRTAPSFGRIPGDAPANGTGSRRIELLYLFFSNISVQSGPCPRASRGPGGHELRVAGAWLSATFERALIPPSPASVRAGSQTRLGRSPPRIRPLLSAG